MMKMWLKMVIYLILGLICAGCVNQNGQYMALASACVEVAPDSAMSILGKVGNIEKESHSQQAFFALLWTQARHKCHLSIENDSLITFATNYYMKKGEKHLAAKALLYKGLVHKQRKEVEKAAEAFALSEQWFEGVEDDQYKALLYNHYGLLMSSQINYKDALACLKKAYIYYSKGDSVHYTMSACASIAKSFKYLNQMDSAQVYFEKGLQYKNAVPSDKYFVYVKDYANFLRGSNEFEKAEKLLLECEQNIVDEQRYSLYSSLATLYYETKDYAKALAYAERMKESTDSLMMRGYYLHLYRIHTKLGNKDVAHDCYKRYTDIHDALQARLKTKEVAVIPHKVEKRMQEVKIRKVSTQRSWLMGAMVTLVVVALMAYYVQRNKHRQKQKEMQQRLAEKSVKIGNLKSIISNKNNKIARMETEKEVQTERIDELEKNVTGLRKEEQEALQMERNLKEKLKQQQQKQEALENKIIELERQRRMMRLQECCAQHPESEKMMELLDFLKGNTVCSFGNSEIRDLLVSLTDMISSDVGSRIVKHVQNEKKQIICNLIALGIDDVAIISKVVILNERTIRKYHRECQLLMEAMDGGADGSGDSNII